MYILKTLKRYIQSYMLVLLTSRQHKLHSSITYHHLSKMISPRPRTFCTQSTVVEEISLEATKVYPPDEVAPKIELYSKQNSEACEPVKHKPSEYHTDPPKDSDHTLNLNTNTEHLESQETDQPSKVNDLSAQEPARPMAKKLKPRVRPNSFVSMRIPSVVIKGKLQEVQDKVVEYDSNLRHAVTSLDKLHITILVLTLVDEDEIDRAKKLLEIVTRQAVDKFSLATNPLELTFEGLGTFDRNVLFAKLKEGPGKDTLMEIAGIVKSAFIAENFQGIESRSINPHLTIAKLSKLPNWVLQKYRRDKRGITLAGLRDLKNDVFGVEPIHELELLSMVLPTADDGYYHCYSKTNFLID